MLSSLLESSSNTLFLDKSRCTMADGCDDLRSKLNLKEDDVDDADDDDGHAELSTGVEAASEGVVVMVGVDDGVSDPMGVVATAACFVEPDHFSYFSFRALMRSAKFWESASTGSFSPSEMSSMSLPECLGGEFGGGGGWLGVGASCRRPSRGSWGFEPPTS